jgi:hypothetical protein
MKRDLVGEYVANVVERYRDTPRSLPNGSLFRLYYLPPNSRYAIFVGLVLAVVEVLLSLYNRQPHPFANSTAETMVTGLGILLILFVFALPLRDMRRLSHAIKFGVSTMGRADKVLYTRPGPATAAHTYAGMTSGAIMATISYTSNGLQRTEELYLDQPWVRNVVQGTQLRLLVDPDKSTILYVIDIAPRNHAGNVVPIGR